MGSALAWFIYNYVAYPFGLFSSTISANVNAGDSLIKSYGWGTLINCFYIPGGFIGGYLSDKIGRRRTMALGFGLQAILGFIMGGALEHIQKHTGLFIVLYGLFLTLGEVGPGGMLYVVFEVFPLLTCLSYHRGDVFRILPHIHSGPNARFLRRVQQGWCGHWYLHFQTHSCFLWR